MRTDLIARADIVEMFDLARHHGADDLAATSALRGDTLSSFKTQLLKRLYMRQMGGAFSFARMVQGMEVGRIDGIEAEVLQDAARAAGVPFDGQRVFVPWSAFTRDLTSANAAAGGYLVAAEVGEALDVLRPWSVTARAGITMLERLNGDVTLPRTSTKASGYWLATQATQVTESTPALGQIALTPKTAGGLVEFSRRLSQQANVEAYVRRELLRTLGTVLDRGVLNGSGASGEPTGVVNTSGIGTQSGTSLAYTGLLNMKENIATLDAPEDSIAYIGTPAVRELLEGRERAAGNGFIWDDDRVASKPAYASTDVPAAMLICGAWSEVIVGLWGSGFIFELNPYDATGFKTGIIQARVLVSADVAVAHATAFCVATSVT